jgi:hypothetical protein
MDQNGTGQDIFGGLCRMAYSTTEKSCICDDAYI